MSRSKSVVTARVRELEKKRENGSVPLPGVRWTVAGWLEHWLENIAARRSGRAATTPTESLSEFI